MDHYSFFGSRTAKNLLYKRDRKVNISTNTKLKYRGQSTIKLEDSYIRSCALKLAHQGDYIEAIALLNQLIDNHPLNAIDYNNRGLIYFQSGKYQQALDDYNIAIQLNPQLASVYNNRANCYAACGDLMAALDDYDQALDLNPHYGRAWINRGITLRDLGKYSEAIDNFEVALLFGQLEANIWAERGRTYHIWGEWNCAIADYYRALKHIKSLDINEVLANYKLQLQLEHWLEELVSHQKN
jgi:tetratricopeptide (TPR) repeat protein